MLCAAPLSMSLMKAIKLLGMFLKYRCYEFSPLSDNDTSRMVWGELSGNGYSRSLR